MAPRRVAASRSARCARAGRPTGTRRVRPRTRAMCSRRTLCERATSRRSCRSRRTRMRRPRSNDRGSGPAARCPDAPSRPHKASLPMAAAAWQVHAKPKAACPHRCRPGSRGSRLPPPSSESQMPGSRRAERSCAVWEWAAAASPQKERRAGLPGMGGSEHRPCGTTGLPCSYIAAGCAQP